MDQNTIALLQVVAAFIQGIAAVAVIPITFYAALKGADRGAKKGYELGEMAARNRETREQAHHLEQLEQQFKSLRLLLSLEIRQNLIDLMWLRDSLIEILGEEDASYHKHKEGSIEDATRYKWFEARQRFIASYMPEWSHRIWYSQQSSHLLPLALREEEIRKINFIHLQLDRLTKIKDMLTERAQRDKTRPNSSFTNDLTGSTVPVSFMEDAPRLWEEFITVLGQILDLQNPLTETAQEAGAARFPALDNSRPVPSAPRIEGQANTHSQNL